VNSLSTGVEIHFSAIEGVDSQPFCPELILLSLRYALNCKGIIFLCQINSQSAKFLFLDLLYSNYQGIGYKETINVYIPPQHIYYNEGSFDIVHLLLLFDQPKIHISLNVFRVSIMIILT
jgi:hypothetical protein